MARAKQNSDSDLPPPAAEGGSLKRKWGGGGLGAFLVVVVSLLAVDEKTKLALSALAPIVSFWIIDILQVCGNWFRDTLRRNEQERQFKAIENDLQQAISNPATSEEHKKGLIAELESIQKLRLKSQKDMI